MKKILTLVLIVLTFGFTQFSVNAQTTNTVRNDAVVEYNDAEILPYQFVQNAEPKMYEYEGEEIYDFRQYFIIEDNRQPVLTMFNIVDGFNMPIDEGGYTWDFGGFDHTVLGDYIIKISYTGLNGKTLSAETYELSVIEKDVTAPAMYQIAEGETVRFNLGDKFEDLIQNFNAVDLVDGLIPLTLENFTGHELIATSGLDTTHEIILTVKDAAGNTLVRSFTIIIEDSAAPVLYGIRNFEAKKGKEIDYKEGIYAVDNNTAQEDIIYKFTIVTDETGLEEAATNSIDFDKVGEYHVKVEVKDDSGNTAARTYRVIVKDSPTVLTVALLINAGVLIVAAATFAIVYYTRIAKTKKD